MGGFLGVGGEGGRERERTRGRVRTHAWRCFFFFFFFRFLFSSPPTKRFRIFSFLLARFPSNSPILSLIFTMMYEISALATTTLPREAETTRREGDESREETERRRLDWPTTASVVVEADRCCLLLGRAEAEAAIAARGAQERTGALARGQEAREAIVIFLSRGGEKRIKRRRERERRKNGKIRKKNLVRQNTRQRKA